jgi:hypothetical protein
MAAGNVRVYYLAVSPSTVLRALQVANMSGMIGPGFQLLLPSSIVEMDRSGTAAELELLQLLDGAIGVFPAFPDWEEPSPEVTELWDAWPKTLGAWNSLLTNSSPGGIVDPTVAAVVQQPSTSLAALSFFTYCKCSVLLMLLLFTVTRGFDSFDWAAI